MVYFVSTVICLLDVVIISYCTLSPSTTPKPADLVQSHIHWMTDSTWKTVSLFENFAANKLTPCFTIPEQAAWCLPNGSWMEMHNCIKPSSNDFLNRTRPISQCTWQKAISKPVVTEVYLFSKSEFCIARTHFIMVQTSKSDWNNSRDRKFEFDWQHIFQQSQSNWNTFTPPINVNGSKFFTKLNRNEYSSLFIPSFYRGMGLFAALNGESNPGHTG